MSEAKKAIIHIEILNLNEGVSSDGHFHPHHHHQSHSDNAAGGNDYSYGGWVGE